MTKRAEARPWDFTQVLDLVNSLSTRDVSISDHQHEPLASPSQGYYRRNDDVNDIDEKGLVTPTPKLGDFAKIWQYLGTPADSPVPEVPALTSEPIGANVLTSKIDYTSDGATYFKAGKGGKGVSWQDEASAEEPGADTVTDRSASPETPTLTKTQRKKLRRKERRAKEAAEALRNATVSESEAGSTTRKTPARKASAHFVPASDPAKRYNLRERDVSGNAVTASAPTTAAPVLESSVKLATSRVAEKLAELKNQSPRTPSLQKSAPASRPNQITSIMRQQSHPAPSTAVQRTVPAHDALHNRSTQKWPVSTPSKAAQVTKFVPSTVQPPAQTAAHSITTQQHLVPNQNTTPIAKPKHVIEPKIVRSGEDRHWALLMKLIGDFWVDRKHLISPMNLTTHNNDPKGLHVFVDASNIFIGFTDQLKRSRGIPQRVNVPLVDLSFDALALLMERRRPVAKRVLVGSTPNLPAFDKAKAVGYECNILEKVYKARELTERQIYFKERGWLGRPRTGAKAPSANNVMLTNNGSGNSNGSTALVNGSGNGCGSNGSGSETNAAAATAAPQYAPARMIEQGVDEILHLKILESIVDTETPSTIVLATGDAAQAEYSQGFMAMVERALKKGWRVELVSWSQNISMMYSKKEWKETWGERFRVVFLDDYAEELLEM